MKRDTIISGLQQFYERLEDKNAQGLRGEGGLEDDVKDEM